MVKEESPSLVCSNCVYADVHYPYGHEWHWCSFHVKEIFNLSNEMCNEGILDRPVRQLVKMNYFGNLGSHGR